MIEVDIYAAYRKGENFVSPVISYLSLFIGRVRSPISDFYRYLSIQEPSNLTDVRVFSNFFFSNLIFLGL